jgi:hypothetical protein
MSIGRLNKRIAKRLSAVETAAGKGRKRLFIHRGYLPETKPGALVCIPCFDTDVLPSDFVYCPGHSPAERDAWFAAGSKDLPPIVGKPLPSGEPYQLPLVQRQKR